MSDAIRQFLKDYHAAPVGDSLPQPLLPDADDDDDAEEKPKIDFDIEQPGYHWNAITVPEAPAKDGEYPRRFIDGCQVNVPVLCVRAPAGWPIPLLLSEVGAIGLRVEGRTFVRDFAHVERVLGFVTDPFPWDHVERFAAALANDVELPLRLTAANFPKEKNPFDYEVMRNQAHQRLQQEMLNLERLAFAARPDLPALMDGQIAGTIHTEAARKRPLVIGVVKRLKPAFDHDAGWNTLLNLRPGQRTPVMKLTGIGGKDQHEADMPRASWYLKLAGGPRLAPNWGYVRIDIPWVQFEEHFKCDFGFVNRLSRWLMDARCRTASYARMPVSLEPIVRAEDLLKPLFTPLWRLANRLARQAGDMS
ncbi:hypothetical protein BH11PLA2_BH11PLA2_50950 [soil metagenome]